MPLQLFADLFGSGGICGTEGSTNEKDKAERETVTPNRSHALSMLEVTSRANPIYVCCKKPIFHHRMPDGKMVFCGYKITRKPKQVSAASMNNLPRPYSPGRGAT